MAREITLRLDINDLITTAEGIESREIKRRMNTIRLLSKISSNENLQGLFDNRSAREAMEARWYKDSSGVGLRSIFGILLMYDDHSELWRTEDGVEFLGFNEKGNPTDRKVARTRFEVIDSRKISKGNKFGVVLEAFKADLLFKPGCLLSASEIDIAADIQQNIDAFTAKLKARE